MKKIFRKTGSLLLAAVMLCSLALQPALAAGGGQPPEEVADCQVESGIFSSTVTLTFPEDAKDWLNAVNGVTVNDTAYEKVDYASSLSFASKPSWFAGTIMGSYGYYDGLQMTKDFDGNATVVIAAEGYENLTISLIGSGTDYTAQIADDGSSGGEPDPAEEKDPPVNFTRPTFNFSDFKLIFTSEDAEWLNAITGVQVNGEAWTAGYVWNNQAYSVTARTNEVDGCFLTVGEGFTENPAVCVISAEGYRDLTLRLDKNGYAASVIDDSQPVEPETYSITVEKAEHGTASVNPAQNVEAGTTVTVTTAADSGYTLESLSVISGGTAVETTRESDGTYFFTMPAGDVTVSAVFQQEETKKNLPSQVVYCEAGGYPSAFHLGFGDDAKDWLDAIDGVTVNGTSFTRGTIGFGSSGTLWDVGSYMGAYETYTALQIMKDPVAAYPAEILVSAAGYEDLVISLSKTVSGYNEIYTAEIKSGTQEPEPPAISLEQISVSTDMFGQDWYFTFGDAEDYVSAITSLSVNGEEWEKKGFKPSTGGAYYPDSSENRLTLSKMNFGSTETLKSGDVVAIEAEGYQDLKFQFVVDPEGAVSLRTPDSQGDLYRLHIRLAGSFEAAIVGQKDYDGVSGATGGASTNKNSQVTVYGALLEREQEPGDDDWKELDSWSSGINIDGSKTYISIVPDTEKGTPADSDSGMKGVYFTISSALTLSGIPQDPGSYLISITAADDQGRTATSNALPFRIYTGEETLADQLRTENLTRTQDGKYMWDIMEPWAIKNFGSNVEGEENSVRVPAGVKAWYGSHESGTYGYLGYDIPWADVEKDTIPQTLYISDGCDLTLVNMEILSSVRIVVEDGGKLTLQDSVVQGIIDVQGGGTFSMNYNGFGENHGFLTGASLCGQLRLQDGAILENAAIYSHINYLANGDRVDRTSNEPVVTAAGNVTVRGQVFIQGDEAGDNRIGQTGLRVQDGTLTLEDDAVLVVYGGGAKVQLYPTSGTAIQLENGTITGDGKVVAIAGQAFWGDGGTAVSGTGSISAREAFLQGATASASNNAAPGKAVDGDVSVTSPSRHIADGTQIETLEEDPLEELYWKTGIDPKPPLEKFATNRISAYAITLAEDISRQAVIVSASSAEEGDRVQIQPGAGYRLNALTVQTKEGDPVTATEAGDGYAFTMPAADVTVSAEYESIPYSITYDLDGGTNAPGNLETYTVESSTITLQEPTKANFNFLGWTWQGVSEPVKEAVIPAGSTGDRSYTAHWSEASSPAPVLSISASPASMSGGGSVTLTVTGGSGKVQVTCGSGGISLSQNGDAWMATLPNRTADHIFTASDDSGAQATCTVSVTRAGGSGSGGGTTRSPVVEINDPDTPLAGLTTDFTDVETGAYYSEAVQWAVENGITSGTSAATFSPDAVCTRAQAVTFLWRASGSPSPQSGENPFTDVQSGAYYYDAVLWAVEQGITVGTSVTTFSPDSTVTRAQVVAFLYRLSGSPAVEGTAAFTDVAPGAFYADAVQWAVKNDITAGTSGETFSPNTGCTRAQILTFLFRGRTVEP